jgi:alpha-glucosidase
VIRSIPPVWDETRVLPESRIGRLSAFARRKGPMWMLAVMAGTEPASVTLPLAFLGGSRYRADLVRDVAENAAAVRLESATVDSRDSLTIEMPRGGGFVARFTQP